MITAQEVLTTTIPDASFDLGLITDETISRSQRKYIRPAVGEDMYDDLILNPTTPANIAVLVFVKRALAWFVLYEAYPDIDIHTGAMGFSRNAVPGTEIIPTSRYALRRDAVFQNGEFERKELKDFICDNAADYPLYCKEGDQNHTGAKPIFY